MVCAIFLYNCSLRTGSLNFKESSKRACSQANIIAINIFTTIYCVPPGKVGQLSWWHERKLIESKFTRYKCTVTHALATCKHRVCPIVVEWPRPLAKYTNKRNLKSNHALINHMTTMPIGIYLCIIFGEYSKTSLVNQYIIAGICNTARNCLLKRQWNNFICQYIYVYKWQGLPLRLFIFPS
jgi:hypothetical protein